MKKRVCIFWFRRDLRLEDNHGLAEALSSGVPVVPIFIFDKEILDRLTDKEDRRVDYIQQALAALNVQLKPWGATLRTFYGNPLTVFSTLLEEFEIQQVYCNRDYEPSAIARDKKIYYFFADRHIRFSALKDQVIFDKDDIMKADGSPYTVYSPYARKWLAKWKTEGTVSYRPNLENLHQEPFSEIHSLDEIGFKRTDMRFEPPRLEPTLIDNYDRYRDYPALQKTSLLGTALRFGTISVRHCVAFADNHNQTWLSELIWREFFMQILYHFPSVEHEAFKQRYDRIQWRNNEQEFERWCAGTTGYPIVDAGMRQLNETGFMHNRVRMIVASFLCKHLLIDWRWGEAYFGLKLNDYDLSANNGNWQWAAGSGCDATPYFRIFNPTAQTEKFDKNLDYVRKWIPEIGTADYPQPIVEHRFARERTLQTYRTALL